jgi:hypothetical protein
LHMHVFPRQLFQIHLLHSPLPPTAISHTTILCLSCLLHTASILVCTYWKKLTCGVIWSFNCFLVVHQSFLFVPQELKG